MNRRRKQMRGKKSQKVIQRREKELKTENMMREKKEKVRDIMIKENEE